MPVSDPGLDPVKKPGPETLPPAGHERREELKRRLESLQAEAIDLAKQLELEGVDPAKIELDREVVSLMHVDGEVYVSNAQPDYRYVWTYRDPYNRFGGRFVHSMLAEGWEVVRGDMPEARDRMAVTSERWAADCLLLRMRIDKYHLLERRRLVTRIAREEGVAASLLEAADRHGATVHIGELPASIAGQAMAAASSRTAMHPRRVRSEHALELARRKLDAAIRTGTVPGMSLRR